MIIIMTIIILLLLALLEKNFPGVADSAWIPGRGQKLLLTPPLHHHHHHHHHHLGKILIRGSVLNSSSWLLQLAAASPKLENAPPRKTSVILIWRGFTMSNRTGYHDHWTWICSDQNCMLWFHFSRILPEPLCWQSLGTRKSRTWQPTSESGLKIGF